MIAELDRADARATALVKGLTPEQLNRQPRPGAWSIGQCLGHLAIGNEMYCTAMSDALVGRPPGVARELAPGFFGRLFIRRYIAPSSGTRVRAPRSITPHAHVDPSILDRVLAGNQVARDLVRRAGNHDVNRIRFRNPWVPVIYFTVGTGLEVLWQHEHRHLLQAERVRDA